MAITQEFGRRASQAVGDYAAAQLQRAREAGDQAAIEAWQEGGAARVALHWVVGGLTGGVSGAAGAAAASAAAPLVDQLQGQLQSALVEAGVDPRVSAGLSSLVGGMTAATVGAVASGGAATGAAAGFNSDMNNRQLHPSEVQRARDLASRSGGRYTQAQIEEQMRLMGNAATGEQPNSLAVTTSPEAAGASIQSDPQMPRAVHGAVIVEVAGSANPELQRWIIANTTEGVGYIPGTSPYLPSNPALNGPVLTTGGAVSPAGPARGNDLASRSGVGVQQSQPLTPDERTAIAEAAGTVSRVSGVVASVGIAVGSVPGAGVVATPVIAGSEIIGLTADVVEQIARPDPAQLTRNYVGAQALEQINRKFPHLAPLTNEVIEFLKNPENTRSLRTELGRQFGVEE